MNKLLNFRSFQPLVIASFLFGLLLGINDFVTKVLYDAEEETAFSLILELIGSLIFDLGVGAIFFLIMAIPYLLLSKVHRVAANSFVWFVAVLVILANAGLNKYYGVTHLSLGSDFFGYSMHDVQETVGSSADTSIAGIIQILLFPLLFGLGVYSIKNYQNGMLVAMVLSLGLSPLVFIKYDKETTNLSYFVVEGIGYFNDSSGGAIEWESTIEYPLLKPNNDADHVLADYLELGAEKPNIVILVVEGLGSDFMGEGAQYKGFTPYLDSLSKESLYWSNFLSNTGRSFGALPSILGSLPFGQNGYLELDNLPSHLSLISVLKKNGYMTSYFEGGNSAFDKKNKYLYNEGVDFILEESNYGKGYEKTIGTDAGFSWGYPDHEIYRKTVSILEDKIKQPRLNVVLSLSNHEPFLFPRKETYMEEVDLMKASLGYNSGKLKDVNKYKEIFASLLYTDESIQQFMEDYKRLPEYENTIFFITGDHRLIPVPQKDKICRYHVPLLVYSPMLKAPQEFKGVSSHLDIMPSIVNMLKSKYPFELASDVPWLGSGLSGSKEFSSKGEIPLMKYKGSFSDYLKDGNYISDKAVFKLEDNLSLSKVSNDDLRKDLVQKRELAKKTNFYVTQQNKIIPKEMVINSSNLVTFTKEEKDRIHKLADGLTADELFLVARDSAHNKNHEVAHLLSDYLLNENFLHFDARLLKGRMYGWDGEFEKAEKELLFVVERNPDYQDAYSALFDLYWWNGKFKRAHQLASFGLSNLEGNESFRKMVMAKLAKFDKSDSLADSDEVVLFGDEYVNVNTPLL